jgi:heptosyltransferase-2
LTANPKILIIQTAFLGDVILALPMVQTLKNVYDSSEIDFLCIPSAQNVLQNNTYIRNVIVYDKYYSGIKGFHEIVHMIRDNKYDIILCPHRSFRSAMITYFSGAKIRIGFDKNAFSFLLTSKVQYETNEHEIKRDLSLVKAIPGIKIPDEKMELKPKLFPAQKDFDLIANLINSKNLTNLITLSPCSKWFTKQLTEEKSISIINELISKGFTAALIGGNDDIIYCYEVEKAVKSRNLLNFCGELTPLQSYILISKAKAHITVDSAAAHLAAATDTPVIEIYGSTIPAFGFYPLTSKHVIIENENLDCRPCTDHGRIECPLKHFKCIEDLSAVNIVKKIKDLSDSSD